MVKINRIDQQFIISLGNYLCFNYTTLNEIQPIIKDLMNIPKTEIILNFSSIQLVDSAGFSKLIELMEEANENGVVFSLTNLNGKVKELISLMKLEQTLKVLDN
ncbi:MAG: STAS domain-containing protein [Bacteroidales bacterium]|nr:STAS domain-containing protein [Bacteroidales bacterium]